MPRTSREHAAIQVILDHETAMRRQASGLRSLTADEVELIAEALAAGAVTAPVLLRRYLQGECAPYQFEGGYAGILPEEAHHVEARERMEAFSERVRSGDLRALVLRVSAALAQIGDGSGRKVAA